MPTRFRVVVGLAGALGVIGLLAADYPRLESAPRANRTNGTRGPSYRITLDQEEEEPAELPLQPSRQIVRQLPDEAAPPAVIRVAEPGTVVLPAVPQARRSRQVIVSVPADGQGMEPEEEEPPQVVYTSHRQRIARGMPPAAVYANEAGPAEAELQPVELVDGVNADPLRLPHGPAEGCASCGGRDGSLCDNVCRSRGCNRDHCPCPTDEVLSYYRCGYYGYYPTFWRPWPTGWLAYRPPVSDTMYDRYRKPRTSDGGEGGTGPAAKPEDVDQRLQELLKGTGPAAPRRTRPKPELLPSSELGPKGPGTEAAPPRTPGTRQAPPRLDDTTPPTKQNRQAPPKLDEKSDASGRGTSYQTSRWFGNRVVTGPVRRPRPPADDADAQWTGSR